MSNIAAAAREALAALDAALARRFDAGEAVHLLARERALGMDAQVLAIWQHCLGDTDELALFAVGGYGRRSLYPHSDVDLLIVAEPAIQTQAAEAIARFIALLWEARIEVAHAVRSLAECREAAADISIHTALMDARLLAGPSGHDEALAASIAADKVWPAADYFQAKREELRQRHARFGDTADNLEPNLKEGPGGLRDLQTLRWMGMRVHGVPHLAALQAKGHIGADEAATLLQAASQLQRLRFGLHLVAGKREERLRFDYQRQLAARLNARDSADNAEVERMMQGFYRSAALVLRIGERLLQRLQEHLQGERPPEVLDADFELRGGWLAARAGNWPQSASDVFALFAVWATLSEDTGLHSETARALAEALPRLPDYRHASAELRAQFMALLQPAEAVGTLRRLSQTGVLAAWIPAFAQVTGRMQFDLFHVYTVDQHTLRLLGHFDVFRRAEARERFSLAHEVWPLLRRTDLLLLAGLFHDIGKGRGGDHALLGAEDARDFCTAMGLADSDVELVAWLVEKHLLMSVTAQKQDISDPEVVQRFAEAVALETRLDMLYLLTCADIAATSPKLWNGWKDRLLADLYLATRRALQRGLDNPLPQREQREQVRNACISLLQDAPRALACLARLPEESFLRGDAGQLVWQARELAEATGPLHVAVRNLPGDNGLMEVFVHSPDRDGLFAAIAATLDRAGLAILQARLLNGADDEVFDTLQVLPSHPGQRPCADDIRQRLLNALGAADLARIRAPRRLRPRHLRHFRIPVQIGFALAASGERTVMSLVATDYPGLLAEVAQILHAHGMRVHDARIATFGERAEDLFQLTDADNRPLDAARQAHLRQALVHCLQRETA